MMTPENLWTRTDNGTTIATTDQFCEAAGGIWPALQALVTFYATNIFAHAATLHLRPGVSWKDNVRAVFRAIVEPVTAGEIAFSAIGRWLVRLREKDAKVTLTWAAGGDSFESAVTAGALAITVPLKYAPLLAERWRRVTSRENMVMLDHTTWNPTPEAKAKEPPEWKKLWKSTRYVPYILPPTTRFPGYEIHKIPTSSSVLPQIIGTLQLVLSGRQIYLQFQTSFRENGLSSPYVIVIPYFLMTLVNLLANMLVSSYTNITVLPMAKDSLPALNKAYVHETGNVFKIMGINPKDDPSGPTSTPVADDPEKLSATQITQPLENPSIWEKEEFDGINWVPELEPGESTARVGDCEFIDLWFIRVWRRQIWTETCTEAGWKITFGRKPAASVCLDPRAHPRAVFLKQHIAWSRHFVWFNTWRIMRRSKPTQAQFDDLKTWLSENYPGIDVDLDYKRKMHLMRGWSILASGLFLQVLVTVCLGALTHFRVGMASHAFWTLIWLYGHPALRWTALLERSVFAAICRSRKVWFLFMFTNVFAWAITFGVYGGIAVIGVELLEAVCGQVISLSPGVWVLTATVIFLSYTFVLLFTYFLPGIIGFLVKAVNRTIK